MNDDYKNLFPDEDDDVKTYLPENGDGMDIFSSGEGKAKNDYTASGDNFSADNSFTETGFEDSFSFTDGFSEDNIGSENFFPMEDFSNISSESEEINSSGEPDDLFSTSENQLDLNSFINESKEEDKPTRKKRGKKGGENEDEKKKGKVGRRILKICLSVFLVLIITGCVSVGAFLIYVFGFIDDSIDQNLFDLKQAYTTTIYVQNPDTGAYSPYQSIHGDQKCEWVDYDKEKAEKKDPSYKGIPQNLANAFVDIEDQRFLEHNGIDWKRTIAAFANMFVDLYSSNQGGSTITQQLIKNITMDTDQTAQRKIREIMKARRLESEYSKETILECYLNKISFANGIVGVQVASKYYFNKEVSELTIAECASLAAIVKEPEQYRPDKFPEQNKKRRKLVLDKMLEMNHITEKEYNAAVKENVKIAASKENLNEMEINSYFVDALIEDVVDALVEQKGMDRGYAEKNIYEGGYRIYSTLNPKVQAAIDEVYLNEKNFPKSAKGQLGQSSMTIMDYKGHVVGIAGGAGEKTTNRGLNRATSSPRQPGSTMKPIAVYSLALEKNIISYSTHLKDVPIKTSTGQYPKKGTGATETAAYALQKSRNAIPVQLASQLGLESVYSHITKNMGVSTLVPARDKDGNVVPTNDLNYSSLCLGGCTKGITTLESCAAFATFGSMGKYYEPTFFTKVTDQYGNLVLYGESSSKTAMSEETAVIMNKMLQNVTKSGGTGWRIGSEYMKEMPTFGKTGTTDDTENIWFAGGTPYFVASCWYGYDNNEKISDSKAAQKIWGQVMKKIHTDLEVKDFADSEYVTCRKYCTASGQLATDKCTTTAIGWYKTDQLHNTCKTHVGTILGEVGSTSEKNDEDKKDENQPGSTTPSTPTTSSKPVNSTGSTKPSSSAPTANTTPTTPPSSSTTTNTTSTVTDEQDE